MRNWDEFTPFDEMDERKAFTKKWVKQFGMLVKSLLSKGEQSEQVYLDKVYAFYEALYIMRMIDEGILNILPPISDEEVNRVEDRLKSLGYNPGNFAGSIIKLQPVEREALFMTLMRSGFDWSRLNSRVLGGIYEEYLSGIGKWARC